MASVTFSPSVGGDGSTVTDDDDPSTGLGNGGSLLRLVPAFENVVNVAEKVVEVATTALGGASTNSTSTTSLAISTGSKSLTLNAAGKDYVVGQFVLIASSASPANYMIGQVTAFTGTTAMTVNVTKTNGSGTLANWTVSVTGQPAESLPTNLVTTTQAHAIALYF